MKYFYYIVTLFCDANSARHQATVDCLQADSMQHALDIVYDCLPLDFPVADVMKVCVEIQHDETQCELRI